MPRNSGQPKRDMLDSHGAGKGDADRSPKWRDHYHEIDWQNPDEIAGPHNHNMTGFSHVGPGRFRKTYGPVVSRSTDQTDWRTPPVCEHCGGVGFNCVGTTDPKLYEHAFRRTPCPVCTVPKEVPDKQESSFDRPDGDFNPVTETGLGWQ